MSKKNELLLVKKEVVIKWSKRTKTHFESLGYEFTNFGDNLKVKVEHLTPGSNTKVWVTCPDCRENRYVVWHIIFGKKDSICHKCALFRNLVDLTGRHFDRLEVLEYLPHLSIGALTVIAGVIIVAPNTPQSIVIGGVLVLVGALVFLAADDKDKS